MKTVVLSAFLLTVLSLPALTASPTGKPEEVGLSSERLARINQMIERRIAAGDLAGAVTIVSRKGKAATLRYADLLDAAKAAGLVDNKVAAFSATHTALRLVIPVALRPKSPPPTDRPR